MSAQGWNSATYNGFYFAGTGGTPAGFPTRDASEYTRLKKQIN
jgi:hypothetical protein